MHTLPGEQLAQKLTRWLWLQFAMHAHRFYRYVLVKMAMQTQMPHDLMRILARRVGQQYLPAWQTLEQARQTALGTYHRWQISKAVRLMQKLIGAHAMMLDQAHQSRAITLPVLLTHGIDGSCIGRRFAISQQIRHIHIHVLGNRRKNGVTGVMQRIVEIEKPEW